jgi:hypothetical protein
MLRLHAELLADIALAPEWRGVLAIFAEVDELPARIELRNLDEPSRCRARAGGQPGAARNAHDAHRHCASAGDHSRIGSGGLACKWRDRGGRTAAACLAADLIPGREENTALWELTAPTLSATYDRAAVTISPQTYTGASPTSPSEEFQVLPDWLNVDVNRRLR